MNSAEPEDSFLTVAEVAEMLKLNQQTGRNWIDQGSLPALRVGRRVRIKRSDFDRILEESYSGRSTSATAPSSGPGIGAGPSAGPGTDPGAGPGTEPGSAGEQTLSAQDFWGGEPVRIPEPVSGEADGAGNGRPG